ncbi:hypothetical protein [Sarcina ventriculi]|uniref:hypothetical protein n=1 Tax=Sarcina ventriculi TaxID=1267 RepID=UPI0018ABE3FB|nr:hypothetical protein [Sarcina ventriculi]
MENTMNEEDIYIEKLIINENYTIGVDKLNRVRISINDNENNEIELIISQLAKFVLEINNLPMEEETRDNYKRDIANIYQVGICEGIDNAEKYASNLKNIIENNLIIQRKYDLFFPTILGFIIIITTAVLLTVLVRIDMVRQILSPIIYGSIGGILSVIIQNNKFNIEYKVSKKILKFEAFKLILLSNIMALIGQVVLNSDLIFSNLGQKENFQLLIYIYCVDIAKHLYLIY